ncbi:MAG: radical SAM protein [archaeon]
MNDAVAGHMLPWARGGRAGPYEVEIRITRKCNLNCFFCPGHDERISDEDLDLNTWLRIARESGELGVSEFQVFAEGEPFAADEALPIMKEVKRLGMMGKTATNGTLITAEKAKELVEIGWDQVYFSIDGPDPKSHDHIRGKGILELVKKNIRQINKEKDRQGSQVPMLLINSVITSLNHNKLEKMIRFAHEFRIHTVIFHPLNNWTEDAKRLALSREQGAAMQKELRRAQTAADRLGIQNNLEVYREAGWVEDAGRKKREVRKKSGKHKNPFMSAACYLPWYFISVSQDGRVNPCHSIHSDAENIRRKSLRDIWYGKSFQKIRKHLLDKQIPADCSTTCCAMQATEHQGFRDVLRREYEK